jgi:hypothetical protein
MNAALGASFAFLYAFQEKFLKKTFHAALGVVALAALLATSAQAQTRAASGNYGDLQWTAQSMLTGAVTGGTGIIGALSGNSIYHPSFPGDTGVVGLLLDYGPGGRFFCSGTLMNDRQSILTAAHCVTDATLANPVSTTVFFQPAAGTAPDARIYGIPTGSNIPAGVTQVAASQYFVHPSYTGDVFDQNDIAVIRLAAPAPAHATSHGFVTTPIARGQGFTVAGYGLLGTGTSGTVAELGRLRNGDNIYDFRLGDSLFGTAWTTILGEPYAQIEYSYLSDMDNGLATNDTACRVTAASNFGGLPGTTFCNTGLGDREVGVAGGDSGGPNFIGGLVSGVNSFGLSFGTGFGDSLTGLNSSFGEFSGYVPTFIHADFINAALVPEPGTYAMMLAGLAAMGLMVRRRQS